MASYKDLCLDATDARRIGEFWATALGQELHVLENGNAVVRGPRLAPLWINAVAEPKSVKNRVHFDLYTRSPSVLLDLGATVLGEQETFTALRDPEGNELCAFPKSDVDDVPARPFALCVDSDRPQELAAWWQGVFGGRVGAGPDGTPRYLHDASGLGALIMKFVPVHDERAAKNRCHWDVTTDDLGALTAAGATVVRRRDDEIRWTVLADPQGNEFCAFSG